MQLCESCGACRETEWRLCPFCRAPLATLDSQSSSDTERFDALAAAAETSERDVLPSLVADADGDSEPEDELITAQDLAHLTGDGGPAVNGWDSPPPPAPAATTEKTDGIDAPVSKVVVLPLVAVALAAVAFVAYSILSAAPAVRPDTVALIDKPTTTIASTTTTEPAMPEPGVVGVDLAEQAARLCSGDQFSIARAEEPSLAIYNDLLVATRDGREDWSAPADHVTLIEPVPSLIGCLTTADGGEIDSCPGTNVTISRRSVTWTYRILRSFDGIALGQDGGTTTEVRSCEELQAEAGNTDMASWATLPQDRLNDVAAAYASAPHPQMACPTPTDDDRVTAAPASFAPGAALHATADGVTGENVRLPLGWQATEDRPVEVVLCLQAVELQAGDPQAAEESPDGELPADEFEAPVEGAPADEAPESAPEEAITTTVPDCSATVRVHAMQRDGQFIGSWDYVSPTCPDAGEIVTPPQSWWLSTVGPALGYEVEPAETEGS